MRDPNYLKFGKCRLFPLYDSVIKKEDTLIVTIPIHNYSYCSTARLFRDMCGHNARKFEPLQEKEKEEEKQEETQESK